MRSRPQIHQILQIHRGVAREKRSCPSKRDKRDKVATSPRANEPPTSSSLLDAEGIYFPFPILDHEPCFILPDEQRNEPVVEIAGLG